MDVLNVFGKTEGVDYESATLLGMRDIGEYDIQADYTGATTGCAGDPQCLCEHSRYWPANCSTADIMYWYHPDYLGNTEFITDLDGNPYQFFWYSPWGESLKDQHKYDGLESNFFNGAFRFNGKEWDEETGLYYMSARYYNPRISNWLSVDPLSHWYPSTSPYVYVLNNPVNMIDPTGMAPGWWDSFTAAVSATVKGWFSNYKPTEDWEAESKEDGHLNLEEVVITAPASESSGSKKSGSMGSGISIYGPGSNGVDNWNSGLNPLFSIDMTDAFWSAFFGWGQKGKYNETIPGSDWGDDVTDMTKSLSDVVQTVDDMEGETVASVPSDPQPADNTSKDTIINILKEGNNGIWHSRDSNMTKEEARDLIEKNKGHRPNIPYSK